MAQTKGKLSFDISFYTSCFMQFDMFVWCMLLFDNNVILGITCTDALSVMDQLCIDRSKYNNSKRLHFLSPSTRDTMPKRAER